MDNSINKFVWEGRRRLQCQLEGSTWVRGGGEGFVYLFNERNQDV